MTLPRILTATVIFFLLAAPAPAERTIRRIPDLDHGAAGVGTFRALVIGIDEYEDPEIPDLNTAVSDARAVASVLENQYGFRVDRLLNGQATKSALYRALRKLAGDAKENDNIPHPTRTSSSEENP